MTRQRPWWWWSSSSLIDWLMINIVCVIIWAIYLIWSLYELYRERVREIPFIIRIVLFGWWTNDWWWWWWWDKNLWSNYIDKSNETKRFFVLFFVFCLQQHYYHFFPIQGENKTKTKNRDRSITICYLNLLHLFFKKKDW